MTVFTIQNTRTTNTLPLWQHKQQRACLFLVSFSWVLDFFFQFHDVVHHSMEQRLSHTVQP